MVEMVSEYQRRRARNAARRARPVLGICERCHERPAKERHHHHGYTGDAATDVICVCVKCHIDLEFGLDEPPVVNDAHAILDVIGRLDGFSL